jgi:hypothetical protein
MATRPRSLEAGCRCASIRVNSQMTDKYRNVKAADRYLADFRVPSWYASR